MIKNVAPVLIPTLNRYEHFKRCVNSLLECELCVETDLYIALDYPLSEIHWEGFNKIQQFIKSIEGFKSVNVIERKMNFGAHKNIISAIDFLFENHETLILTEDDNIFSSDFLTYMDKCLNAYKEDNSVFSVCGYNYPVKIPKSYKLEIYRWQGYSAWGVGFWRDKFLKIDWSKEVAFSSISRFLRDYNKVFQFNEINNNYVPALMHSLNSRTIHGDIYICMYQFLNGMSSVFPVVSRVRNMGNDGSGENCWALDDDIYSKQEIYVGSGNYSIPKEILSSNEIDDFLKTHFFQPGKLRTYSKLFSMNIGFDKILRWVKTNING